MEMEGTGDGTPNGSQFSHDHDHRMTNSKGDFAQRPDSINEDERRRQHLHRHDLEAVEMIGKMLEKRSVSDPKSGTHEEREHDIHTFNQWYDQWQQEEATIEKEYFKRLNQSVDDLREGLQAGEKNKKKFYDEDQARLVRLGKELIAIGYMNQNPHQNPIPTMGYDSYMYPHPNPTDRSPH